MANTLVVKGVAGPVFLNLMHVEALIPQTVTPMNEVSIVVRMTSGEDYVAYFDTREQMKEFVLGWAGEMVDRSNEPIMVVEDEEDEDEEEY
jgi:hypothetical protein